MKNTPILIHAAAQEINEFELPQPQLANEKTIKAAAHNLAKPKTGRSECRERKGAEGEWAQRERMKDYEVCVGKILHIFFVAKPKKSARFTARCCLFDGKLGRAAKPPYSLV